jgi:hypothetical protein
MKGKTRMTINRETLKEMIEEQVRRMFNGAQKLAEFNMARNGSVEIVVLPVEPPANEPRLAFDTGAQEGEVAN